MASNMSHFYIFKSPTVIMRSFDTWRKILNPINRSIYAWYDPTYNMHKFMDGAVQAALLGALNLREKQFDKFREISTEKLTDYMRQRIPELPTDLLQQRLQFNRQHFINGFVHSSVIVHKAIHKKIQEPNEERMFISTFVFYIDRTPQKKWTCPKEISDQEEEMGIATFHTAPRLPKLLKRPEDFLICNMTLGRVLTGMETSGGGRWRITDLNFFDCELALDKINFH